MKPARLSIVHQLPLERYPPVLNLLEWLDRQTGVRVQVLSSEAAGGGDVNSTLTRAEVVRIVSRGAGAVVRWMRTLAWHGRTAWRLKQFRPDVVLSVEPHSALAVWLYFQFFRGRARLLIQHYEYYAEADYCRAGNRLLRLNRWFERSLYLRADRVSQTNSDRLRLFSADNPEIPSEKLVTWPNYPPGSWFSLPPRSWPANVHGPLRLVVAGALSLRDTYIGPLVEWVLGTEECGCTLDVYASQCDAVTAEWLRERCGERLRFHAGGVAYSELPGVLRTFDVGLILYRCRTVNFVWNATNKLFEYLTCGLDVWYPPCMLGIAPYARSTAAPRVLETDFDNLQALDLSARKTRSHLPTIPWTTTCEDALKPLLELLEAAESR